MDENGPSWEKTKKQSALNSVSSIIRLSQLSQWNSIFHPLSNFFHFMTDLTPKTSKSHILH
jgi:hypothetical protein